VDLAAAAAVIKNLTPYSPLSNVRGGILWGDVHVREDDESG
jgi:hypothetical protein